MMVEGPRVGDRVSYEDMANPRRVGAVVSLRPVVILGRTIGTDYEVRWDGGGETISDLRQHGWKRVRRLEYGE